MITEDKIIKRKEADLKIIIQGIVDTFETKPYAIYLCGGQGRNEGAWYEDSLGAVFPYNDYDLAVISDSNISHEKMLSLRKQLAKKVSIDWIDIGVYNFNHLKEMPTNIHNYDLLYASTLIYGDDDLLKLVPVMDKKLIGVYDLDLLYRTRMWTLLGSWKDDFHDMQGGEARFFKYQLAKCILAACDMILIKNKAYCTSYKRKSSIAPSYYPENELLKKRAQWAISEKLRPSSTIISKSDAIVLYNDALELFKWAFAEALGKRAKYYLNPQWTNLYYHCNLSFYKNMFHEYRMNSLNLFLSLHDIFLAQNYILNSYTSKGIKQKYVNKASKLLISLGVGNYESWEAIHYPAAEARNNI